MPSSRSSSRPISSDEIYKRKEFQKLAKRSNRRFDSCALIEKLILISVAAFLTISIYIQKLQQMMVLGLELWKWGIIVITVGCGRLLMSWLVIIMVFLVEKSYLPKKAFYLFHGVLGSFRVCAQLSLVLATWCLTLNNIECSGHAMKIRDFVSRLLASLFIGSLIWLVKNVMVKLLADFINAKTFFGRIQGSIFHQHVLQSLSGRPMMGMLQNVDTQERLRRLRFIMLSEGKSKEKGAIDVSNFHKLNRKNLTLWTMEGLVKYIRVSECLIVPNMIDDMTEEIDRGIKKITSEGEAKAVADTIFRNVAKSGERHIEEEDLLRFLTREDVRHLLSQFVEGLDCGKIEKSEFNNWVVKAYIDRKYLVRSLKDMETTVKQLNMLISAIVLVIIIITISLLMIEHEMTKNIVFIDFLLLLVLVYFSPKCKTTLESIMFVFIGRHFDVGDQCDIDGVKMTVEEINLFTTTFLIADKWKINYSNAMLAKKVIKKFAY